MNFFLTRILPWLLVIVMGFGLWFAFFGTTKTNPEEEPGATVITHHMVVDKIESLGKLELTRFYLKDIVEQKEVQKWYRDDKKIVLIISGEVIGCIDLTKIDSSKVMLGEDSIVITLPQPEVCSFKINHQESKVYYINTSVWDNISEDAAFIDRVYKLSESNLQTIAIQKGLFEQTRKNAKLILQPLLENMTGKKVILKLEKPDYRFDFPLKK